ncbi:MAG: UDP-2,3-diacylglucosamine diphosphatase, partial [Crocinitomicaceae bacterium]|nr:UDP-2,3-diacylglucosamine diphosphatase [Crocinitomicaceae bacterium]
MSPKRKVEIVVISDVHLGTYGSRAGELVAYLRSIQPEILILNGDIIDIWQFSKHYFPADHMQVVKEIATLLSKDTKVYYITGNHDEMLRKFKGFKIGNFEIQNKLILPLKTGTAWFFHGDVFDTTMKHSKWIAKLGGKGYDLLIMINTIVNWFSEKLGKGRISLSKKVKDSVKGVIKYVNNFEETAADIAIENGFQFVVCGHIHQPQIKKITKENGDAVTYLNSGDWVENSTSLEYNFGKWTLYK